MQTYDMRMGTVVEIEDRPRRWACLAVKSLGTLACVWVVGCSGTVATAADSGPSASDLAVSDNDAGGGSDDAGGEGGGYDAGPCPAVDVRAICSANPAPPNCAWSPPVDASVVEYCWQRDSGAWCCAEGVTLTPGAK